MKTVISGLLLVAGMMLMPSCNKKKDTIAKIYVLDTDTGERVAGATVRLKGISTEGRQPDVNLDVTTLSNASGEAIFNFNDIYKKGQAGVAILDIEAHRNGPVYEGIIKVEEETTSEATIFI